MKRSLLIICLSILCLSASAQQDKQSKDTLKLIPRKVDSTLLSYYNWCNSNRHDPNVLLKTDTMYRMAKERDDKRMQAVALSLKADHYYVTQQFDSLKAWIPRIEQFARKNDQLRHYYFVWSRLILHYTKRAQYTLAQFELERYVAMAAKDGVKAATADGYIQLAHIYRTKGLHRVASEYYETAINYIEQNDLDKFSLSNYCIALSTMLMQIKDYDGALAALEKGKQNLGIPEHFWLLRIHEAIILAHIGRTQEAHKILVEVQNNPNNSITRSKILESQSVIYEASGQIELALKAINELMEYYQENSSNEQDQSYCYSTRANLYASKGEYANAYHDLRTFITLFQKRVKDQNESALGEFATLLDVNRLESERAQIQQQMQSERLQHNKMVIGALCLIILLGVLIIIAEVRSNHRLHRAKEAAEGANRMKSAFIHTVTHEINTPLNAIVGFAELAATQPTTEQERNSYIDIIHTNSRHLEKLVNNVLYISDLESIEQITDIVPVDLNACLNQCITRLSEACAPGVTIKMQPTRKNLKILTSPMHLQKIVNELLNNAAQFTKQGHINLSYTVNPANSTIQISVTDTGCGIPLTKENQIFERFVKLDNFSTGIGLGLSVCEMAANKLGGKISLDRQYIDGSRFVVTLPFIESQSQTDIKR